MKTKSLLFLLLGIYLSIPSVYGTHMMGADMTYMCLGDNKYKIIAKIYRDCRGVALESPNFGVFVGNNGDNSCGSLKLPNMTRTSIKDVTTRCSTSTNPCYPSNTYGTGKGIEEHTYEAEVDFSNSPLNQLLISSSCCEVTFYINQCCRNGAITTGAANDDFYTTCMINICNLQKTTKKCNNSPLFTSEPIGFACCNQAWFFNNGAIDTVDFDSISYQLVKGLKGLPNNSVNYTAPFNERYFMTPFCIPPTGPNLKCTPSINVDPPRGIFFDGDNGDIVLTPTNCNEVPLIVIEQTEFRKDSFGNWIVIGKTRRDIQIWVHDECGYNKPPKIIGPFNHNICAGEKLCFKVKIEDPTFTPNQSKPDTVIATWNKGIPKASFQVMDSLVREKEYEFCWQTHASDASDIAYTFHVRATDQHCSPPMTAIRAFKIKVNSPNTQVILPDSVFCLNEPIELKHHESNNVTTQWSIKPNYVTYLDSTNDQSKLAKIAINIPGNYEISLYSTICNITDTSTVKIRIQDSLNTAISRDWNTLSSFYSDTDRVYFQWLDCEKNMSIIDSATFSTFTSNSDGNYALGLSNDYCEDTSDCFEFKFTNIKQHSLPTIKLHPNPNQNKFNLDFGQIISVVRIKIIDALGKSVWEQSYSNVANQIIHPDLSSGIYQVQVWLDGHFQTISMVVEK